MAGALSTRRHSLRVVRLGAASGATESSIEV
jgi:hypothetical protein